MVAAKETLKNDQRKGFTADQRSAITTKDILENLSELDRATLIKNSIAETAEAEANYDPISNAELNK